MGQNAGQMYSKPSGYCQAMDVFKQLVLWKIVFSTDQIYHGGIEKAMAILKANYFA
jgi:hypothetical protein